MINTPTQCLSLQNHGPQDFLTNIRANHRFDLLAAVHQLNFIELLSPSNWEEGKKISFESNVYDVDFIGNVLIASNNYMPVRLFDISPQASSDTPLASFYDRKPNSQLFLSPLQLASDGDRVVGGGKKFLSSYDCNKLAAYRLKAMDKKYISSVQLLGNCIITGQFKGELEIIDSKSGEIVQSIRPHMDLVTRIKKVGSGEHYLSSLARKDNLCYLWDIRNMDKFVTYFHHEKHKNQRTGLQASRYGTILYIGGQGGQVFVHSLDQDTSKQKTIETGINKSISALCQLEQGLLCGVGERGFPMLGQQPSDNFLLRIPSM